MADLDLDALEAALAKATPGPWVQKFGTLYPTEPQPGAAPLIGELDFGVWPILAGENAETDAAAIVAIVNAAPRLIEIARAAADLLEDTQHADHDCGDPACPVDRLRAALNPEETP